MSVNRTHITRNRTILILLGILLAFILTLNASTFYSADIFLQKRSNTKNLNAPRDLNGTIEKTGVGFLQILSIKFTSLK